MLDARAAGSNGSAHTRRAAAKASRGGCPAPHPWLSPLTYWPVNGDEKVASKSRQYSTLGCSLKLTASISAGLGLGALPPAGAPFASASQADGAVPSTSLFPAHIMYVPMVAEVSNGSGEGLLLLGDQRGVRTDNSGCTQAPSSQAYTPSIVMSESMKEAFNLKNPSALAPGLEWHNPSTVVVR